MIFEHSFLDGGGFCTLDKGPLHLGRRAEFPLEGGKVDQQGLVPETEGTFSIIASSEVRSFVDLDFPSACEVTFRALGRIALVPYQLEKDVDRVWTIFYAFTLVFISVRTTYFHTSYNSCLSALVGLWNFAFTYNLVPFI